MSQGIDVPVPAPEHVRELLARNLQENRLLRSLLKVSERTEQVRRLCEPINPEPIQRDTGEGQ